MCSAIGNSLLSVLARDAFRRCARLISPHDVVCVQHDRLQEGFLNFNSWRQLAEEDDNVLEVVNCLEERTEVRNRARVFVVGAPWDLSRFPHQISTFVCIFKYQTSKPQQRLSTYLPRQIPAEPMSPYPLPPKPPPPKSANLA